MQMVALLHSRHNSGITPLSCYLMRRHNNTITTSSRRHLWPRHWDWSSSRHRGSLVVLLNGLHLMAENYSFMQTTATVDRNPLTCCCNSILFALILSMKTSNLHSSFWKHLSTVGFSSSSSQRSVHVAAADS